MLLINALEFCTELIFLISLTSFYQPCFVFQHVAHFLAPSSSTFPTT